MGKSGWFRYPTWSLDWTLATATNLLFLGASSFVVYAALTKGNDFSREPVLAAPPLGGRVSETIEVEREPRALAECIAKLNHGQAYDLGDGNWRVAVRNGRNSLLYTFEIHGGSGGSFVKVRRWMPTPFGRWSKCLPAEVGSRTLKVAAPQR